MFKTIVTSLVCATVALAPAAQANRKQAAPAHRAVGSDKPAFATATRVLGPKSRKSTTPRLSARKTASRVSKAKTRLVAPADLSANRAKKDPPGMSLAIGVLSTAAAIGFGHLIAQSGGGESMYGPSLLDVGAMLIKGGGFVFSSFTAVIGLGGGIKQLFSKGKGDASSATPVSP
ncbi:MAG: hypothetical protein IPL79_00960 [Myxococcales bacterium]|nr:hypothetical protein [Myxococcales bacterium]